jgi:hypothetical protein
MSELKEYILAKRPTLGASSLTTYASVLKTLHKNVFGEGKIVWDNFKDTEKVLAFLNTLPPNRGKTIISALVVITDIPEYKEALNKAITSYNKELATQLPTETQKENWITKEELQTMFDDLKKHADWLYKKKTALDMDDLQNLQNFVIVALLCGVLIEPRRSKDYTDFKIKNITENKDNFMTKTEMVFNSYKTVNTYGTQKVEIPKVLKSILTKWCKVNPTDWLLFDKNSNPLTPVKLNQRFNKIFHGKKVSVNNFRHTYITDKFTNYNKDDKEAERVAKAMGTSKEAILGNYVKILD